MGWAGWALVFPGQWLGPGVLGKVALPGRGSWETPGEEAQHGGLPRETRGRPEAHEGERKQSQRGGAERSSRRARRGGAGNRYGKQEFYRFPVALQMRRWATDLCQAFQGIGRVEALTRGWAVEEPETIPKGENREVRAAIRVCTGVSVCSGV